MPTSYVKKLSKKHGISVEEAEKRWDAAKEIAKKEGKDENFAYITGIFKKSMGETASAQLSFIDYFVNADYDNKPMEVDVSVPNVINEEVQNKVTYPNEADSHIAISDKINSYISNGFILCNTRAANLYIDGKSAGHNMEYFMKKLLPKKKVSIIYTHDEPNNVHTIECIEF